MNKIPEQFPLSWLKEQVDADEKFSSEALVIRLAISSLQPEHIRETHTIASSAIGLINYWLVNRDLSGYQRGRPVDDFAALTITEWEGSTELGIANLESTVFINRDELLRIIKREQMTVPDFLSDRQAKPKNKGGRPPTNLKKAEKLRQLVDAMSKGENVAVDSLPGSTKDLLDACNRIEKALTGKSAIFRGVNSATLNNLLNQVGYGVKIGRTLNIEATYWTKLAVKVIPKLTKDIFL